MSLRPEVSIVVPVYGVDAYLEQCVDSLLSQQHKHIEVILVNDGSQDKSGDMCDEYAAMDRRVRVIHKENGGLVSARKAGVAVATGAYLGFVDGDDWVGEDYFASLYDQAASSGADLAMGAYTREFFGKCEVIRPRCEVGIYGRLDVIDGLLHTAIYNGVFFQHGVSTYVWNKLFRRKGARSLVQGISSDIVMGEDAALTYPYLASSERVVVCATEGYFYRQRSNSIVKSVPNLEIEYRRLSALFRFLKAAFERLGYYPLVVEQLRYYFYAQVLIRSGAFLSAPDGKEEFIPFRGLRAGSRLVVYSSGSFGQHMVSAIRRTGKFDVVAWTDEDHWESQQSGLPVTSVDSMGNLEFDAVVIAAIDTEFSARIAEFLGEMGIDRRRIFQLDIDFERLDCVLRSIGFDTQSYSYLGSRRLGNEENLPLGV